MVLRVVAFCRDRGHDVEVLCATSGLSLSGLAEPDARVSYETAARVGERALELTCDEHFGLHLAQDVHATGSFDAGMLLLMASPTVRACLERMVANQRYWGDGARATLQRRPSGLAVRYVMPGPGSRTYARHANECAMAELALGVRVLSGEPLSARVVRFQHPRPSSTAEHRALFGCPIEFASEHTEIELDDVVLDARLQHANAAFAAIFEQQIERALARLPPATSVLANTRAVARAALAGGGCTLSGTARALGSSTRTLQRQLRVEGTSFNAIVDALRRELAIAYLERGLPVPEIASLLGYADTTAFYHAFRRWTGSSPARYAQS